MNLTDNPIVIVAGIFVFVSALMVLIYCLQWPKAKRLVEKLVTSSCPSCGVIYGQQIHITEKNLFPRGRFDTLFYDKPELWVAICPHCRGKAEYNSEGQLQA